MSPEVSAANLTGARRRALAQEVPKPQLAMPVDQAPEGDLWFHEIKLDGYRMLCHRSSERVKCISRNGKDWTGKLKPVADAIAELPGDDLLLDGEVAVVDSNGITEFQALQNTLGAIHQPGLVFFLFDILYTDGHDVTSAPLEERKQLLAGLFADLPENNIVRSSDHIAGNGPLVLENACQMGVEGIVSKRRDKCYQSGRQPGWLKIKCKLRDSFVVVGFTLSDKPHRPLRSLMVAEITSAGFQYCGRVGSGFTDQTLEELHARLDAQRVKGCPFDEWPESVPRKEAVWVAPQMIVEVEFANRLTSGALRHPTFKGVRDDVELSDLAR